MKVGPAGLHPRLMPSFGGGPSVYPDARRERPSQTHTPLRLVSLALLLYFSP